MGGSETPSKIGTSPDTTQPHEETNTQPVLIQSKGYFEVGRFRRATSVPVEVDRARGLEWLGL